MITNSSNTSMNKACVRGGQIWISRHWNRVLPRVTIAIWLFNIQICLKKVKIPNICQKRSKLETLGGNNRKTSEIADNSCCIQKIKIITLDEINSSELNWIKTTVDVREKPILFSSPHICPLPTSFIHKSWLLLIIRLINS